MKKFFSRFVLLISIIALAGCRADVDLGNIDPSMKVDLGIALPIGEIRATVGDLLGSGISNIYVREDGVLYFKDTFSIAKQFHPINLANYLTAVENDFLVKPPYPIIKGNGTPVVLEFPMVVAFNNINEEFSNERIDSALISSAQFTSVVNVENFGLTFSQIDKIELVLPDEITLSDGRKAVEVFKDGSDFGDELPIVLPDFHMNMMIDKNATPSNTNVRNELTFKVRFTLNLAEGEEIIVNDNSKIDYILRIDFLKYDALFGWFKPSNQMQDEAQHIIAEEWPAWASLKKFAIPFSDPTIEAVITTEIGVPLSMHVDYLSVTDLSNNKTQYAKWNGNTSLDYSFANYVKVTDPIGAKSENRFIFSNKESEGELGQLLCVRPDVINYGYFVKITDDESVPQQRLTQNTDVNVDAIITLPFSFNQGLELEYADTLQELNVDEMSIKQLLADIQQIDSIKTKTISLYILAKNYLPFNVDCDFRFLDENGQDIDVQLTNTHNHLHVAGPTDFNTSEMQFMSPGTSQLAIEITEDNINKVSSIKSILYSARISDLDVAELTDPAATYPVSIRYNTSLNFKIGIAADVQAFLNVGLNNKEK